jgi:endonuclease/exonuclease/phosphatase family metal-dependent hydrolase
MIIASWNIESRLSNNPIKLRTKPDDIINEIKKINADILVLLEAHNDQTLDNSVRQKLIKLGYEIKSAPYDDDMASRADSRHDRSSLIILSKLDVTKFNVIKLANIRNCLIINVADKLRLIGVHLDDRHEDNRVKQVNQLSKIINQSDMPTVVLGDFNAMHGEDLWPARFLKFSPIKFIIGKLSTNLGIKAIGMATGDTLKTLESNTNLRDADPKHQPTVTPKNMSQEYMPSIRLIQIDHIYTTPDIKISNFRVHPDGGSDHRAISANLDII